MSYLVDTNVLSELRKRDRANDNVQSWFAKRASDELYISVLTLGELRRGVEQVRRRDKPASATLEAWLDRIAQGFLDRILDVDRTVAEEWGRLSSGNPIPDVDALLAATAFVHDLTVVTRNVRHIAPTGVRVLNPFSAT